MQSRIPILLSALGGLIVAGLLGYVAYGVAAAPITSDHVIGGEKLASAAITTSTGAVPTSTGGTAATTAAVPPSGRALFKATCSGCHTLSRVGVDGGALIALTGRNLSIAGVRRQVLRGGGGMPSFADRLDAREREAVARYVARASQTASAPSGGATSAPAAGSTRNDDGTSGKASGSGDDSSGKGSGGGESGSGHGGGDDD